MYSVDIGCGSLKRADIGVDIQKHYKDNKLITDIIADAHYLPFKDGSFSLVRSHNLIEHCVNPFQVFQEMKRITSHKIITSTDNGYYWRWNTIAPHPKKDDTHYMLFFPENLDRMFKLLNFKKITIRFPKNKQKFDMILRLIPKFRKNSLRTFEITAEI
ncbi:MAG: class I SAM-dependent methyltransferase [Candidatus Helarchaeota archaeon]